MLKIARAWELADGEGSQQDAEGKRRAERPVLGHWGVASDREVAEVFGQMHRDVVDMGFQPVA